MRLIRLILAALTLACAAPAAAGCTLSAATGASFAAPTSYEVQAGGVAGVSVAPGLSCSGAVLSLLSGDRARARATSANGFRLKNAAGDTIRYRLSADQGGQYSFGTGATIDYMQGSLLSLLGILNNGNFVPTMYAALTEAPNLPAGTYTDTVTVQWDWSVCTGLGLGGVCILADIGTGQTVVTLTLTVTRDCRISTPAIAFGSAPLASQFVQVAQAVAVDCTKGTSFSVAFSKGKSGSSRPWRTMRSPGGQSLQYNLYRPDGVTVWDDANPLISQLPGTGSATPGLIHSYIARINPNQPTPAPGTYTDTLSVIVSF